MIRIKSINTLRLIAFMLLMVPLGAFATTTLVIDGNNQLTGARNVVINGGLFNVDFMEGSCVTLYSGCDDINDFIFHTLSEANAASTALLDQVLIDGVDGNFDSSPASTFGCGLSGQCLISTFYGIFALDNVFSNTADNRVSGDPAPATFQSVIPITSDSSSNDRVTRAVWSSAVPVPAAIWLFGSGLIGLIGVARIKKS